LTLCCNMTATGVRTFQSASMALTGGQECPPSVRAESPSGNSSASWCGFFVASLLFLCLGCHKTAELNFNEIAISVKFAPAEKDTFSKMFVTYKNIAMNPVGFVLPVPADEDSRELPKAPFLGIILKSKNGAAEEFLYAQTDGQPKQEMERITLSPGETKTVEYLLSAFWRWGPCGPDRWGSFSEYIRLGDNEVEAKVFLLKVVEKENEKGGTHEDSETLASLPEKLQCSLQAWLFKTPER